MSFIGTLISGISSSFIASLSMAVFLLLVVELLFYFAPGVSLSSLLIAMLAVEFGFLPALLAGFIGVELAHFIIRRDPMIAVIGFIVLAPMAAVSAFFGPAIIEEFGTFGWPLLGAVIGAVKWGVSIPVGFAFGRNMSKRVREIILEPAFNFFIFWKLRFLFMFLFK